LGASQPDYIEKYRKWYNLNYCHLIDFDLIVSIKILNFPSVEKWLKCFRKISSTLHGRKILFWWRSFLNFWKVRIYMKLLIHWFKRQIFQTNKWSQIASKKRLEKKVFKIQSRIYRISARAKKNFSMQTSLLTSISS